MSARAARLLTVAAVSGHAAALYVTFKHLIAPVFAYSGLTYRSPDSFTFGMMLALTLAVAFMLPRRLDRPSAVILWIVFTFTVAPSIQLPQYLQLLTPGESTRLGIMVAAGFLLARAISAHPPLLAEIKPRHVSPTSIGIFLGVVGLAVLIATLMTNGVNLSYLSFDSVYSVRAEFVANSSGNALVGYGLPAVQNVVNPLLMGIGLLRRNWWILATGVIGQVAIYSTVGTKNTLFSILFIIVIAPLAHRKAVGALIPLGMAVAVTGGALIDWWRDSIGLTSLTTRRVLMVPGALTAAWVSVYSALPQLHFAGETGFGTVPLEGATYTVGRLVGGDATTSANVSMFGHGYAQYGYFGLIIECIVFGFMLRGADWATKGLPPMIAAALFIMPAQAICEASIFTSLTTHAFLFALVVAALLPRDGWSPIGRSPSIGLQSNDRVREHH